MPTRWTIPLDGPIPSRVAPEWLHAVVSRWLDVDHKAPVKAYAVSPGLSGPDTSIGVRLLDDELAGRLVAHTMPGTKVRLGNHRVRVATPPRLLDGRSWIDLRTAEHDLASKLRPAWTVAFRSPATFRNGARSSPWPAPESILTGLLVRWRGIHAQTAPDLSPTGMRTVWVTDVEGSSDVFELRGTIVSGFTGTIRYACDGDPDDRSAVGALLEFANYAGVGSHTAFGLGDVLVERSHPVAGASSPAVHDAVTAEEMRSTLQPGRSDHPELRVVG